MQGIEKREFLFVHFTKIARLPENGCCCKSEKLQTDRFDHIWQFWRWYIWLKVKLPRVLNDRLTKLVADRRFCKTTSRTRNADRVGDLTVRYVAFIWYSEPSKVDTSVQRTRQEWRRIDKTDAYNREAVIEYSARIRTTIAIVIRSPSS